MNRPAFRSALRSLVRPLTPAGRATREQLLRLTGLPSDLFPVAAAWTAATDFLLPVARELLARAPDLVVDVGSGLSTAVCARCVELNGRGRVVSLEHDAAFRIRTLGFLREAGVQGRVEVVLAPLADTAVGGEVFRWYGSEALAAIDAPIGAMLIDGPPGATGALARYPAGPLLFPRMAAGGAVFVDDAGRADERMVLARFAREFPEFSQSPMDTAKGAVILRRRADAAGRAA